MSRKIIGITVGTQLPKPNFKQTDPTKGDYIKNKPDFDGLKSKVNAIDDLVGDTKVHDQIAQAIDDLELGNTYTTKTELKEVSDLVGNTSVFEQIDSAVSQKSQVQIITWGADD